MAIASTPAPAKPYMLLFRNTGPELFQGLTDEKRGQLISHWNNWFEGLLKAGKASEGQPLGGDSKVVVASSTGTRVIDGPFAEAKEAVGGYVTVWVSDIDEAAEIARRHPALPFGMKIEVRPLDDGCHLGVVTRTARQNVIPAQPQS